MRRRVILTLLLAVALVSRGGAELEGVELVQVLGVDGRGPVTLTAVGDGEEPRRYQALGRDTAQAQEALEGAGDRRLEVTHVSQLVLGRGADGAEVLYREVLHRKSGYGAAVWLAETGTAAELLARADDPAHRLRSLRENAGARAPGVLEALRELSRTGQVTLPVVGLEEGELTVKGYETIKGAAERGG